MKYEIGQSVWVATWDSSENYVTCPDCGGTGRIRVIHHDDTVMSIECAGCSLGYDPPTGRVRVYDRRPRAELTYIVGVEITAGKTEWNTKGRWHLDEAEIYETEDEALAAAVLKAEKADREEREKIATKEKPTRTWSWNAHYHRRQIKDAERNLKHHTAKLAVARLKAKEDKQEAENGNR